MTSAAGTGPRDRESAPRDPEGSPPDPDPPSGDAPDPTEVEASHLSRVARRAVVRITVLEYVLLAGAVALAVLAGGLASWALAHWAGLPLVPSWVAVSVVVFAVPAVAVWRRERREDERLERARRRSGERDRDEALPDPGAPPGVDGG